MLHHIEWFITWSLLTVHLYKYTETKNNDAFLFELLKYISDVYVFQYISIYYFK